MLNACFSFINQLRVTDQRRRTAGENELLLQLWQRSQDGDSVAFRHLADRLYRSLFNYAFNFTRDRDFIKDTIQELLIAIWVKRRRIQMEFVSLYFLKSLRNQLIQEFRRPGKSRVFFDVNDFGHLSDYHTIEGALVEEEIHADHLYKVRSAIEDLPKRQREAVFLKYYEGVENEKIAEIMQINRQSVANLLFRALTTLKAQIV